MFTPSFPQTLQHLRHQADLTNRELAEAARVPVSLIAGLQSGRRRVGEQNARQIGTALGLKEAGLQQFVLLGMSTCTRKVLQEAQQYPAPLLNIVAQKLRSAGVLPDHVQACETSPEDSTDLRLILTDGRVMRLEARLDAI
jgi:transcriptional regulator with XRE-family HTH domain